MKATHSNLRLTCRLLLTVCMSLCLTQMARADRTFTIQLESPAPTADSLHTDSPISTPESVFTNEILELPAPLKATNQQQSSPKIRVVLVNMGTRDIEQPSQYLMRQDGTHITNQRIRSLETTKLDAIHQFFRKAEQIKSRIHRKVRRIFRKRKRTIKKNRTVRFRKVGK